MRTLKRLFIFIVAMFTALAFPAVVLADPALPDSAPSLSYIYVNRSLLEANDYLLVAEYDMPYAVFPDDPISDNYIYILYDHDGVTHLGMALPYAFNDSGYNKGAVSFYFPAASAPSWGDSHIIRLTTNPATFSTTTTYTFTIPTSAYSTATNTQAAQQAQLAVRVKTIATHLEQAWSDTLLSQQDNVTILSSTGEAYFREAIPGLQGMAPSLFFVQSVTMDTSNRVWGDSLSDTYQARLWGADGIEGTADDNWIYTSIARVADLGNIPVMLIMGLILVGVCAWLIYKSNQMWGTAMPGYMGSLAIVICFALVTLGFTLLALIGIALVIIGGWFLFMRRA